MKVKALFNTKHIMLALLAVLFVSFALHQIINTDIFFHIKCGNDMLKSGMIINKNVYSFADPGYEFSNHAWFSKVLFAIVYNMTGIPGINILVFLLLSVVFARIAYMLWKSKYFSYYYFAVALGLIIMAPRFQARPQLFSFVFFAIYLQILQEYVSDRNRRLILAIVPLQYMWNNMHAYSILGVFVVGCFILDSVIRSFYRIRVRMKKMKLIDVFFKKNTLSLTAVLLLQVVSYFVMYRFDLFIKMFIQMFTGYRTFCFYFIQEFLPVSVGPELILLSVFVVLTLPFVLRFRKAGDYARCIIYVIVLLLSLRVSRNLGYFVITALTFSGYELQKANRKRPFLKRIKELENKKGLLHGSLIAVMSILIVSQLCISQMQVTGLGIHDMSIPISLADFLEENEIKGNGFNEFALGSYLIFRLHPGKRVFIHNQVEAYPPDMFTEYMNAYHNKNTMTRLINKHAIKYAVVKSSKRARNILEWFAESKRWELVYFDGLYFVFVLNDGSNGKLIEKYSIKETTKDITQQEAETAFKAIRARSFVQSLIASFTGYSELGYTRFNNKANRAYNKALAYLNLKYYKTAEAELIKALRYTPWDTNIIDYLYILYGKTKDKGKLESLHAEVQRAFPKDRSLTFAYAEAVLALGDFAKSTAVLDQLDKTSFSQYKLNKGYGDIFMMQGLFKNAEEYYLKSLEKSPSSDEMLMTLGKLYLLMGELNKSRIMLEKYMYHNKYDVTGMLVLADVYKGLSMEEDARLMYMSVLENDRFNEKATVMLRKKD